MIRSLYVLVVAGLLAIGNGALAQGEPGKDVSGSKDHPRVSRFKGSVVATYKSVPFGQLELLLANPGSKQKAQNVEGALTNIVYVIPAGHDTHEVYRSYLAELEKGGYSALYKCVGGTECGGYDFPAYFQTNYGFMGNVVPESQRYLAARRHAADGDSYVMLYAYTQQKESRVILSVVDAAALEKGLVTITADALTRDITTEGHAIVQGVMFETDRATLKSESDASLKEMAKVLTQNPALKVFIVGHTDNVGAAARNLDLSQKRAESVTKALQTRFQIDGKRMESRGAGPFAPIASNRTDDGRSRNRRVELVER